MEEESGREEQTDGGTVQGAPAGQRSSLYSPRRVVQFGLVGVLGMALDTAVLGALYTLVGFPIWAAKLVGAEAAIVVMFASNEAWTFGDVSVLDGHRPLLRRFARSNVVRVSGIAVATVVLVVGHDWLGVWWPVANVVGIGCGFVFNYVLESLYTWRLR